MDFKISFLCRPCKRDAIIRHKFYYNQFEGVFVPEKVRIGCKVCGHSIETKLEIFGIAVWDDGVLGVLFEVM